MPVSLKDMRFLIHDVFCFEEHYAALELADPPTRELIDAIVVVAILVAFVRHDDDRNEEQHKHGRRQGDHDVERGEHRPAVGPITIVPICALPADPQPNPRHYRADRARFGRYHHMTPGGLP